MDQKLISGIEEKYNHKILALLRSVFPEEIILFGSRAKGNYREGSDIDIALKGKNLTLDDRSKINIQYPDLNLPWQLDIVIYNLITEPKLKEHIDKVGIPLK